VVASATWLADIAPHSVVVAGSHGGDYVATLLGAARARAAILHDAGIGLNRAGVRGLETLGRAGVPAVAVDYRTARIGDAKDMLSRGRLSTANEPAHRLGCRSGQAAVEALGKLMRAGARDYVVPELAESRVRLAPCVVGIDSAALIEAGDADAVVITGSHGGLLDGQPRFALKHPARLAVFHDAGIGIDEAGVARLPVLEAQGVAALTVSATSAEIGDCRSIWAGGIVSRVNGLAASAGVREGMGIKSAAAMFGIHPIQKEEPA
jgi:hypothetical protein